MLQPHYPVIVAGAGPTGLALANLLGCEGIGTLLLERNASTVSEPRAASIDDEALRTTQAIGLIDQVLANVIEGYGAHYFAPSGRCFARVQPSTREFGFARRSAFRQPLLEATLREGLERFAEVDARFNHRLEGFEQTAHGVELGVRTPEGKLANVACDYLIGADGASSMVRELLGIDMQGTTFNQRWLIVDMQSTPDRFHPMRVFCDPARLAISLPGPHGTRRYEFMLHASERDEDLLDERVVRDLVGAQCGGPAHSHRAQGGLRFSCARRSLV